jgi:hypothetical protein
MLSHALTIVMNELEKHLTDSYGSATVSPQVRGPLGGSKPPYLGRPSGYQAPQG